MILVPDDDGGVALFGVPLDNGLDFDDPGTGGVDDLEARPFSSFSYFCGGTPWARMMTVPVFFFFSGKFSQKGDPLFFQHSQDLGIVDQRTVGVRWDRCGGEQASRTISMARRTPMQNPAV